MLLRNVLIAVPLVLCLAACATQPAPAPAAGVAATASKTTAAKPAPQMVYVTGSRLAVPISSSGRAQGAQPTQTVGEQQLTQSGQTNNADALRMTTTVIGK